MRTGKSGIEGGGRETKMLVFPVFLEAYDGHYCYDMWRNLKYLRIGIIVIFFSFPLHKESSIAILIQDFFSATTEIHS